MKFVFMFFFVFLMLGCPKIKYENDTLIPSAVAGSPEYPVSINDQWCKDSKGVHGFCAIRLDEGTDVKIKLIAKPYAYRLDIQCFKNGVWSKSIDVLADTPIEVVIKASEMPKEYAFSCIGDIYPHDRPEPTAAFFEARFRIVKKGYVPLEATYRQDKFQVFGKFAYNVQMWDGKKWLTQMRMPVAEIPNTPSIVESYNMRLNVYGF